MPRARILVVDDEPSLCAVMRRLLKRQHEVVAFHDAREALAHLRQGAEFDVVFCDIMMPHMSGIEFFRALEKLDADLATRTVFLTGGVFNTPTQQFLAQSPNLLLEKPFETRSLESAIARLLESRVRSGTWQSLPMEQAI